MVAEELQVLVKAEVAEAVRNLDQLKGATRSAKEETDRVAGSINKTIRNLAGAYLSYSALKGAIEFTVSAYVEQERQERLLAASLRTLGGNTSALMDRYRSFASEIQRTTTIGDEQALGLIRLGLQYGITTDRIEEATKGAIGLSSAIGVDVNTAMRLVAQGLQGNYEGLSRYIPQLRAAKDEAEKAAIAQKILADSFKIAEEESKTTGGALKQMKNAVGDLAEAFGSILAPAITSAAGAMTRFLSSVSGAVADSKRLNEISEKLRSGKDVTATERVFYLEQQIAKVKLDLAEKQDYLLPTQIEAEQKRIRALEQQLATAKNQAAAEAKKVQQSQKSIAITETIVKQAEEESKFQERIRRAEEEKLALRVREASLLSGYRYESTLSDEDIWAERRVLEEFEERKKKEVEAERKAAEERIRIRSQEYGLGGAEYENFVGAVLEGNNRIVDDAEESARRWAESWKDALGTVSWGLLDLWEMQVSASRESANAEIDAIRKKLDAAEEEFEETKRMREKAGMETEEFEKSWKAKRQALEEEARRKEAQIRKRQAEKEKELRIAQTIAAGAQAVITTFASLGYPWGIPAAAAMAAITAAKVSIIKSQKIPELAEGGIVYPRPGGTLIRVAEAGKPEAIVPLDRGLQGITVHVHGVIGSEREVVRWVIEGINRAKRIGVA